MKQLKIISRWKSRLVSAAVEPYRGAGRFAWHFARGKLSKDPIFAKLLRHGVIPSKSRILDLGCGQGLLAAWLHAAKLKYSAGDWPDGWPAAPEPTAIRGIELMPRDVQRAKQALGDHANIEQGDIRTADFGHTDVVVILDVLHYMEIPAQDDVLRRVRSALGSGGTLVMRVGDAAGGLPFRFSKWVDLVVAAARGHHHVRLYCRTLEQWTTVLRDMGFTVESFPMSQGTPFANVLLAARC